MTGGGWDTRWHLVGRRGAWSLFAPDAERGQVHCGRVARRRSDGRWFAWTGSKREGTEKFFGEFGTRGAALEALARNAGVTGRPRSGWSFGAGR